MQLQYLACLARLSSRGQQHAGLLLLALLQINCTTTNCSVLQERTRRMIIIAGVGENIGVRVVLLRLAVLRVVVGK